VVQSVLREANRELGLLTRESTNLVSLAYPATYSSGQRERLIELVNSATLEDGTHFRVVGTIMEPAAAALDYLAQRKHTDNTTVLVFDLGGGTFDLSLVTCYPKGKIRSDKSVAYYDIHLSDGLPSTGGNEFDEVTCQLLQTKMNNFLKQNGLSMTAHLEEQLRLNAETVKKELTLADRTVYESFIPALEDTVPFELTRKEFEQAPRVVEMLRQMTDKARNLLETEKLPKPETIVLTGGSCRMPMIRAALVAALPEHAGRIGSILEHRPETAISYGAARYGAPEPNTDTVSVTIKGDTSVIKRAAYDIGLRYYRGKDDKTGFISCLIPRGTELPVSTRWNTGHKLNESETSVKYLYEARTITPDRNMPERDYRLIKKVTVHFGQVVPVGTTSETRLVVDKDGLVTIQARKNKSSKPFVAEAKLTTTFD
jgi:molecular chaperone DnaK (HSP70)